jgi:hypothetical protein
MKQMKNKRFGAVALILGFAAFGLALAAGPLADMFAPPPKPSDEAVADIASKVKGRLLAKATGRAYNAPAEERDPRTEWIKSVSASSVMLGFLGLGGSLGAFIRREEKRVYVSAAVLSVGAIALWYLMFAICVVAADAHSKTKVAAR